jgi:hypothetical protein
MSAGDKLLIKIEGGCSQFAPTANTVQTKGVLHKRQTISVSDSNTTLRNPFADGSLTYVAVNLGDLGPGTYNLQVSLGGQVDNLTVLDSDGETYAKYGPAAPFPVSAANLKLSVNSPSGPTSISFSVGQGLNLSMALIAYTSTAVNVSYTGTGQVSATSGARILRPPIAAMLAIATMLLW